jgi:hypothetical protein
MAAKKKTEVDIMGLLDGGIGNQAPVAQGAQVPEVMIGINPQDETVAVSFNGAIAYEEVNEVAAQRLMKVYVNSGGNGFRVGKRATRSVSPDGAQARTLHTFEEVDPTDLFEGLGLPRAVAEQIGERCKFGWFNGKEVIAREDRYLTFVWRAEPKATFADVMSLRYGSRQASSR